jgi:hypothetical protein
LIRGRLPDQRGQTRSATLESGARFGCFDFGRLLLACETAPVIARGIPGARQFVDHATDDRESRHPSVDDTQSQLLPEHFMKAVAQLSRPFLAPSPGFGFRRIESKARGVLPQSSAAGDIKRLGDAPGGFARGPGFIARNLQRRVRPGARRDDIRIRFGDPGAGQIGEFGAGKAKTNGIVLGQRGSQTGQR